MTQSTTATPPTTNAATTAADATKAPDGDGAASQALSKLERSPGSAPSPRHVDPLWIMLVIGAVLFSLESWRVPRIEGDVVLTRARLEASETTLRRALGREPTPEELDASLRTWIDAEIAVREARRLGLDRDDPIVRRRLVQKVEQLLESTWDDRAPTSEEIDAWIATHPERYRNEPSIDLSHVFVAAKIDDDAAPADVPARVQAIQAALRSSTQTAPDAAIRALADGGDGFVHGSRLRGQSRGTLVAKFGERFATSLFAPPDAKSSTSTRDDVSAPTSPWRVLASRHGWHVVHVDARHDARDGVREVVAARAARDWLEAKRDETREAERERLRRRYRVTREDEPT